MSDLTYLAWSLAFTGVFAGLFGAIVLVTRHFRQRRRAALGLDAPPQHRQRFRPAYAILYAAFVLLVGLYFANLLEQPLTGKTPPGWSELFGRGMPWLAIMGVVLMLDSFQPEAQNPSGIRVVGIFALLVGAAGIGLAIGHVL